MIKRIKENDLAKAIELIRAVYYETEYVNDDLEGRKRFEFEFCDDPNIKNRIRNDELFMYGYYDSALCGVISIDRGGYIIHLFVDSKKMGHGIASSLVRYVIGIARKRKIKVITLDSSVYAKEFYLHHGFKMKNELVVEDGMSYIPMYQEI